MTASARVLLDSFDRLPESDRRAFAAAILRRVMGEPLPPLDDEEMVLAAEELFLELDDREAADARR